MSEDNFEHEYLEVLLRMRRACRREGASSHAVQKFLAASLEFVRAIMTEEVFNRALRSGEEGEGLLIFANRVSQLTPLLKENWPSEFSFRDLGIELFAIANGDKPRILKGKGKQGKFRNAHSVLEKKLESHARYKTLGHLKLTASKRQSIITESYGISIDAFNAWRKEENNKLTPDYFNRFFVTAVDVMLFEARSKPDPVAWAAEQTRLAGLAYREKLGRTGE